MELKTYFFLTEFIFHISDICFQSLHFEMASYKFAIAR